MSERERRGIKTKATAAILLVVTALSMPAQAQQDDVLTLACKGTSTTKRYAEDERASPVSMGLIVNLTARTMQGFNSLMLGDPPDEITAFNDVEIQFFSKRKLLPSRPTATGERGEGDNDLPRVHRSRDR